jgi:acyl-CoA thioesterase I
MTIRFSMFILIILTQAINAQSPKPLRYIAFGDSYTICTGTKNMAEQWPTLLTKHLNAAKLSTKLIANPSHNGFSTEDVINNELPLLKNDSLDLATLLIGVNDWVRSVDIKVFQKNLVFIMNTIQKKLTKKQNLILITIPDFGVTPQGSLYGSGRDIASGIAEFNAIIKAEAKKRGLVCVDIFATTQAMKDNKDLIADDGLHPSAKEYALWEQMIFKGVQTLLSEK